MYGERGRLLSAVPPSTSFLPARSASKDDLQPLARAAGCGKEGIMTQCDPQVKAQLERQVRERTGRRIRNLTIEVRPESVVLGGQAPSYYLKQLAQHGVRDVLPSIRLENSIDVAKSVAIGQWVVVSG